MEKFEETCMKQFITLMCNGNRVYYDENNNAFGCGTWLCKGYNPIPFSNTEKVSHFNSEHVLKDHEYNTSIYKYTDNVGSVYEYNGVSVTVDPKYTKLFRGCDFSVDKGFITCWYRGVLVGLIMGIPRRSTEQ